MKRDVQSLQHQTFDLVVVGGGVHGACVARDAALRGLKVALVEQDDFCSGTSHNSLKTIHGGIRYLQHLNFKRAIESAREQQIFLETAPHLVQRLDFLMPAYGHGMRGPVAIGIGIVLFECLNFLVSLWDNRRVRRPRGRLLSARRCTDLAPGIDQTSLTGGGIWADAQVTYADKAVLQMLQQAEDHGACVLNYVRAEKLLHGETDECSVCGVEARDLRTGDRFGIAARSVVNASGPWAAQWIKEAGRPGLARPIPLVRSMNLVTNKPDAPHAIAVKSQRASDSRIDSAKRLYFLVPWQGKTVVGTTHFSHRQDTVDAGITPDEVSTFVDEINAAYPTLDLTLDDVLYSYHGLTPGDSSTEEDGAKLHESIIVDHAEEHGVKGVFSIIGIKWTTARLVAEQTVDTVLASWNEKRPCKTRTTALEDCADFPHDTEGMSAGQLESFVDTHIEKSQAYRLSDLVLRRTNDLVLGRMTSDQFATITRLMAARLGWSEDRQREEVDRVLERLFPSPYRASLVKELDGLAA